MVQFCFEPRRTQSPQRLNKDFFAFSLAPPAHPALFVRAGQVAGVAVFAVNFARVLLICTQ